MVGVRTFLVAAAAISSSVLASFEPLAADDLFARAAPGFEPLEPSRSARRSTAPVPRAAAKGHARRAEGDEYATYIAGELDAAIRAIKPLKQAVADVTAQIKTEGHNRNPVSIVSQYQPKLAALKGAIQNCGNHAHHPHPHPQPSSGGGGGGWGGGGSGGGGGGSGGSGGGGGGSGGSGGGGGGSGGSGGGGGGWGGGGSGGGGSGGGGGWGGGGSGGGGGCGSRYSTMVSDTNDMLSSVSEVAKDVPILKSLLDGYVSPIDDALEDMIGTIEGYVPGFKDAVGDLTSSLTEDLKSTGLSAVAKSIEELA